MLNNLFISTNIRKFYYIKAYIKINFLIKKNKKTLVNIDLLLLAINSAIADFFI